MHLSELLRETYGDRLDARDYARGTPYLVVVCQDRERLSSLSNRSRVISRALLFLCASQAIDCHPGLVWTPMLRRQLSLVNGALVDALAKAPSVRRRLFKDPERGAFPAPRRPTTRNSSVWHQTGRGLASGLRDDRSRAKARLARGQWDLKTLQIVSKSEKRLETRVKTEERESIPGQGPARPAGRS